MAESEQGQINVHTLMRALRGVRAQARFVWVATLLLGVIGAAGVLLVAGLVLDHYLVLTPLLRLGLLLLIVGVPIAVFIGVWRARPGGTLESMARLIERRYPSLDNLLINTVQLVGAGDAMAGPFVEQVAAEAEQQLQAVNVARAINKRSLALAAVAALIGAACIVQQQRSSPDQLREGVNRVLLPFGDNTFTRIIQVLPGDADVLVGADVDIVALVGGRVPTQATLECELADHRTMTHDMTAKSLDLPDRLVGRIEQVDQDLTYRVRAGDGRSLAYHLRVHERPRVEQITQRVHMPDYMGLEPRQQTGGTIRAFAGSRVELEVRASQPFASGRIEVNGDQIQPLRTLSNEAGSGRLGLAWLDVAKAGRYRVYLTDTFGFDAEPVQYDILLLEDEPPQVAFVQPTSDLSVDVDAKVVIEVRAQDDYGLKQVELRRDDDAQAKPLAVWPLKERNQRQSTQTMTVKVADLGLADKPVVLRAVATDDRPGGKPVLSAPLTFSLRTEADASPAQATSRAPLADLLALQRTNIEATTAVIAAPDRTGLPPVEDRQEQIRRTAATMAKTLTEGNAQAARQLELLSTTLMAVAIEQLRAGSLAKALDTENAILKALTAAESQQSEEASEKAARELAQWLAELVVKQRALRVDSSKSADSAASLRSRQIVLSRHLVAFQRAMQQEADTGAGGNKDLAANYRKALDVIEKQQVRAGMLLAAEQLGDAKLDDAGAAQDKVVKSLEAALAILRESAMADARKDLKELKEDLKDAKGRLDKLVEVQQSVTEVAQQLEKTKDRRDGRADEVEIAKELDEVRKQVEDAIEQLVKDMHLFPTTDISNDLLTEMGEIYEDIKQKKGSENKEIQEIAVDRDEGTLAALKKMQEKMGERLGDVEMWMPDEPDTIRWKQESYDKNEMGNIPLGDLPDALEDIVGDLTEQAKQLMQEAQDSASNVGLPDATMGWDIADGPMPSWAAKGKSGNQRPNEMEQVGRSGSGRQGMSSGEVVGDTLKALEGSQVKTRRTQDPFQAGELKEEDPNFLDVKATGGGKLAGITLTEGMTGEAPARDALKYRDLQRSAELLRKNTQSVYTKAKLLRLPTGEMDKALLELDAAERRLQAGDISGFLRGQQEVVRAMKQTEGRLTGQVVVEESSTTNQSAAGAGATSEPIPSQYENSVAEYMRRIAGGQ